MKEIQCMICGKKEQNPQSVGAVCRDCLNKSNDEVITKLVGELKWVYHTFQSLMTQQQNVLTMMSNLIDRVDQLERRLENED